MYIDCSSHVLQQLALMTRDLYLPLLCNDQLTVSTQSQATHGYTYSYNVDRMIDILHRLMAHIETTKGQEQVGVVQANVCVVVWVWAYFHIYEFDIIITGRCLNCTAIHRSVS